MQFHIVLECDSGWTLFEKDCYKFFLDTKDWNSAETVCLENSAHLASVHSDKEVEFLNNNINRTIWIGLEWKGSAYQWSDRSAFDFNNWKSGEPNAPGGENCTSQFYEPDTPYNKKWNDVRCDSYGGNAYVCKKRLKGK